VYEVEIQNGLDLLDEKLGRDVWLSRIDPARIRMLNPWGCVAAQATGVGYDGALTVLEIAYLTDAVKYGFELQHNHLTTPIVTIQANWKTLEREWQDTIAAMKFPD